MNTPHTTPTVHPAHLAVVEVDQSEAVQCQAEGCGHRVYRRIDVVSAEGRLRVLGSTCCERLFGFLAGNGATPRYGSGDGRRLTDDERRLLEENTQRLIEMLEAEHLAAERRAAEERAAREQAEAQAREALQERLAQTSAARRPPAPARPARPVEVFDEAEFRAAKIEAREMLRAQLGSSVDAVGWGGLIRMARQTSSFMGRSERRPAQRALSFSCC